MKKVYFELKPGIKTQKEQIKLGDVCDFICDPKTERRLSQRIIKLNMGVNLLNTAYVMDVIRKTEPEAEIYPFGRTKCKILYTNNTQWTFVKAIKVGAVALTMFFGGAISILYFHADVAMNVVHSQLYEFATGTKAVNVPWVSIPYTVGLLAGFVFLLNVIKSKKNTEPSLLELDVNEYHKQIEEYLDEHGENANVIK